MTTEYCSVCGCVVPFCKHTEVKTGPWLRVCVTPFGTHITDNLHMGSLDEAIEHCKATLKLNPEYPRVKLHEGATSETPVVWDSEDDAMAEAAMMMCGVDPKPARKKPEFRMRNPQFTLCSTLRPDLQQYAGKAMYVAIGHVAYPSDEGKLEFHDNATQTSLILKVDIECGYFETRNSIYFMV